MFVKFKEEKSIRYLVDGAGNADTLHDPLI